MSSIVAGVVARAYGALIRVLEVALIGIFSALTLDVLWGVFSRYVLGHQGEFTEELAIYLLVWLSLLGAALTYAERGHLGVDYLVSKLDPAAQRLAAVVVELLVIFFSVVALVWGGFVLVSKTLASDQVSPALGVEVGYVYLAVPISGVFFVVFALQHLWELWHVPAPPPPAEPPSAGPPSAGPPGPGPGGATRWSQD